MKAKFPILVKPVEGEGLERFYATSSTRPATRYLVDLTAHRANGWCGCPGFAGYYESGKIKNSQGQSLKDLDRPGVIWKDDTFRCKHIVAVRRFLGNEMVDTYLRNRINQSTKKH